MLVLRIVKPEQGAINLPVVSGQTVAFDFDIADASFERSGDDLVILFEEGRSATLTSFFAAGEGGALTPVLLAEGVHLSGEEFLRIVESGEDIITAMGHAPDSPDPSGGIGAYRDGPGEMISGVDRLGALEGLQFQPDSAGDAVMFSQFPASALVAASEAGTGGSGEPGGADAPYVYVRAALLGANGIDKPIVVVDLLNPDGTRMKAPYPDSVEIRGNESYDVAYDSATGKLTISLKNPEDKAAPTENVEITVGDTSYIVQVGSSESNNLADVIWAPVEEGALLTEKTWAGAVDNHLKGGDDFVEGQTANATIVTPDGYEGKELHLQLRNSSLTARDDMPGAESASVDLKLKDGSFLISNEGKIVFTVHHDNPVNMDYEQTWDDKDWGEHIDTSGTEYTAAVVAAVAAKGENAVSTVAVTGGEAIIQAGGPAPNAGDAANVKTVNIGAVYAAEGGTSTVSADVISIGASSDGFVSDGYATVSGVRADGAAVKENPGGWPTKTVSKNSEVNLEAEGNVSIATAITGDTASQDHQGITYAGVAATERGHVNITAEDVSINVTNQAGDGSLKTSGVYGIFSGVGLGGKDMPTLEDFSNGDDSFNEYAFNDYKSRIVDAYLKDKRGEYNQESGKYEPKGHQTSVTVESEGDVNVSVDLGTGDHIGNAAGIKAAIGDVDVISRNGSINVNVSHEGTAEGDLSALAIDNAIVNLRAEGDVNLTVSGNGTGVSVVDFHPFSKYSHGKDFSPSHISGNNVVLRGEAGRGGSVDNSIIGFDAADASFKYGAFTIHADEKVSIDVTALHNGGNTSSTGIAAGGGADDYHGYGSNLTIAVDAPEFEIKALVTGDVSKGTSTATGILADTGSYIGIRSYDSSEESLKSADIYMYEGIIVKPVDKLTVTAKGALHNAGIVAHQDNEGQGGRAMADVRASELNVAVTDGAPSGVEGSSSHGLLAKVGSGSHGLAKINVETEKLTVTVEDAAHSVGLSAQGAGAEVNIGSVRVDDENWNVLTTPLTVTITCTVTGGEEALRGVAIEAIDGGHVKIISNQNDWSDEPGRADTVILNGDIVARNDASLEDPWHAHSKITIDTNLGDDRLIVNGDIRLGENCDFTVNMGGGNDVISLGGNVSLEDKGSMIVDAGEGDDLIHLNGKIELDGGLLKITGGEGDDLLVLQAPDAAAFEEWYKAWLESDGVLESLQCEAIVVSGVDDLTGLDWLVNLAGDLNIPLTTVSAEDAAKITDLTDYWGLAGLDGADTLDTLDTVDTEGGMDGLFASSGMPEGSGRAVGGEAEYSISVASTASGNEAEDLLFIQLATSHN